MYDVQIEVRLPPSNRQKLNQETFIDEEQKLFSVFNDANVLSQLTGTSLEITKPVTIRTGEVLFFCFFLKRNCLLRIQKKKSFPLASQRNLKNKN